MADLPLANHSQLDFDPTTGEMVLSGADGSRAIADTIIVGSCSTDAKGWLWAWANPCFDAAARGRVTRVQRPAFWRHGHVPASDHTQLAGKRRRWITDGSDRRLHTPYKGNPVFLRARMAPSTRTWLWHGRISICPKTSETRSPACRHSATCMPCLDHPEMAMQRGRHMEDGGCRRCRARGPGRVSGAIGERPGVHGDHGDARPALAFPTTAPPCLITARTSPARR